ncbi:hypothetical protein L1987_64830 [Smallanthus sonchifolius]|uniref:Uncharacterized protein n=1 Tax=Smallanthus sonchifolius TaxID=185202 RepID=A0ACB9BSN0_9ASTR|nr:hypothetical protein L1987_64830 [Smallanthus sonchifolius]
MPGCSSSSKAPAEAFRDSFPPSHKSLSRLINEVPYLPKSVLKLLVCYWKWAIAQWFASVEGFREAAMDAINQVTWTHLSSVPVLESEDEDGFPISFAANDKDNTSSGKKVAEESNRKGEKGQAKRKKEVDDSENKAKRKKDDSVVGHDDRARCITKEKKVFVI